MMQRFLESLTCTLPDENHDYREVKRKIGGVRPFVVFQPIISFDFAPMHILENTGGRAFVPSNRGEHIYVCPIGSHGFFIKNDLEKLIKEFYLYDELPEQLGYNDYEIYLEEMILLRHSDVSYDFDLGNVGKSNIVYVSAKLAGGHRVHVLLICDKQEAVWKLLAEQYSVGIDVLVESAKGCGTHFKDTVLFEAMQNTKAVEQLPGIVLQGLYASGGLPMEFEFVHCEKDKGEDFEFFLTPWGKERAPDAASANAIREKGEEKRRKYERCKTKLYDYLRNPEGEAPLEVTRELLQLVKEAVAKDGGVSDFENIRENSSYRTPWMDPTEELQNRVDLFVCLAALYVFDSAGGLYGDTYNELFQLINYHLERVARSRAFRSAYAYVGADEELEYFMKGIYESAKILCSHKRFANFVSSDLHNEFEEALLKQAYANGDVEFAHWIIENDFLGLMQSKLYCIIFKNDKEKAKEIATRLHPRCIAWILKDTCMGMENRHKEYVLRISEEIRLIFANITLENATGMESYIKSYKIKDGNAYCREVYETLMNEYFGGKNDE